ncbi:AAA family ATPase, partial [Candidatus Pacearchaeota archaeon]|nr:AAA family ATPase [Candidatus Pacearchaeota archaeon]
MKIKKIKVKNIRSYESQEMEFPEGSILLSGEIGSGKTSILLAIEYALFGLQPGQKGTALLRNNTNYGEVYLEVIIDGRKIVIERKLRKTSKGVSNEYAAIIIDGEKIESSLTEIKSKIIELLGYPKEFVKKNNLLYRYTVYAQQENMKQIIFEDAETRLNILRHIFGVDKYKQIKNNLSIFLNYLKGHVKLLQGEISDLEDEKEELNSTNGKIALTEEKINLETQELYNKTRNRKLIEQELKKTERKIQEKRSLIEEINKIDIVRSMKKESLDSLREEIIEEEKVLRNNADNFNEKTYSDILESLKDKKFEEEALRVNYLDIVNRINSLRVDLEDILSKKERIFRIDICPTCLQNVSDVYKHNIVNEVEKKSSSIRSMIEKLEGDKLFLSERIN